MAYRGRITGKRGPGAAGQYPGGFRRQDHGALGSPAVPASLSMRRSGFESPTHRHSWARRLRGEAPGLHPGIGRFDPGRVHQGVCPSWRRRLVLSQEIVGSSPTTPANPRVAQSGRGPSPRRWAVSVRVRPRGPSRIPAKVAREPVNLPRMTHRSVRSAHPAPTGE